MSDMFPFDFEKTLQAAAYLLRRSSQRSMTYTKLIKVLYIADRESLRDTAEPLTGDRVVAMTNGPVLSRVYDLIKGVIQSSQWSNVIETVGYSVRLRRRIGHEKLCQYEIDKLEELLRRYRNRDWRSMVRATHAFREWQGNKPAPGSRKEISLRDILKAVGRAADAADIETEARARAAYAKLVGA